MSGNKLRVLALVHRHLIPPETIPEGTDLESAPWRTEYNVATTLRAMGHEVQMLAVHDDLGDIRRAATEWKPQIAFNLLEGFDDVVIFDQNVVSHLELLKLPYTGCNPRRLLLARDKSLRVGAVPRGLRLVDWGRRSGPGAGLTWRDHPWNSSSGWCRSS